MELQAYEKKHLEHLRTIAPECMVLLKSKGDFPLSAPGKLALYGNGARHTMKGGTGSGDVNSRFYYTVESGLEEAGFSLTTKGWLDAYDAVRVKAKADFVQYIKQEAKRQHVQAVFLGMGAVVPEPEYENPLDGSGDTAVYVLTRQAGEGNDRKAEKGDYLLTDTEVRDILACWKKYPHFILVLNVGGIVDLTPVLEVENILLMSQLGAVGGQALADVLLGKSYPSGKLSGTWAPYDTWAKMGEFGNKDDTRYHEGIYVGYRYFETAGIRPTFSFGHGLGYTTFEVAYQSARIDGTTLFVEARVTNTGSRAGRETVQLYVSAPWGKLDHPKKELAAFEKTGELLPGESETVTLKVSMERLASYDEKNASFFLETGSYLFSLGASSAEMSLCCAVSVEKEILVRKVSNVGGCVDFTDWRPAASLQENRPDLPVLHLSADAVFSGSAMASGSQGGAVSPEALEFVKKLSDEDLCRLCVGRHKEGPAFASVIGSAAFAVAGAAGESCERVEGVSPIVMADGPAGLRIAQRYQIRKGQPRAVGESLPAGISDYMPKLLQIITGSGKQKEPKGEVFYQYCTAIPIGTALAQSWNPAVGEVCGDIVGAEMQYFGIHQWLAPALNIHRNPLCGRNFEYYSEDPLLGGLLSAAVCRGIEAHKGRIATIKHFCCNNQETNRYQSNSVVSERALREIYLKGFEICIKEGNPGALMTSYNLLNGVHTSAHEDLLKTVLREEWGWKGLVVSDWIVTGLNDKGAKYPVAGAAEAIAAGNDVFMPGNSSNVKEILAALQGDMPETGLSRDDVELCAARLVETVWRVVGKKDAGDNVS